jgi:glycerophosphoryl diester phosphodiesterase
MRPQPRVTGGPGSGRGAGYGAAGAPGILRGVTTPRTGLPYLDDPRSSGRIVALAHRGGAVPGHDLGLENTLPAFENAVRLGYHYLETDVHATSDGHLLTFHDELLDRVTDRVGRIRDHAYAEITSVRVSGREPIPRLSDLLETFPDVRWNVDLKSPRAVDPMVELIRRTGAHERVCVGSFSGPVLRRFRSRAAAAGGPEIATSVGVAAVAVLRFAPAGRLLEPLLRDAGRVFQVPHVHRGLRVVDRAFVERAHAGGRHVHVWTVNDRAEMEHLLDLGVDGLITDRTDLLRDVLVDRGLWEATP